MAMKEIPVAAVEARRARSLREVADLDYRRSLLRLRADGLTQKARAVMVGVAQPTVQKLLVRASTVTMPVEGFSGADPYEICERYAAGLIHRAQLVDELTRWEYLPVDHPKDPFDDLLFDVPGSIDDLERALQRGLIDENLFDEIADLIEARPASQ